MGRLIAFLYGLASYLVFFVTFLYAIGFVSGLVVPKTIDSGMAGSMAEAFIVNLLLMSLFAAQHSVMARKQFKQWWTQYVPKSVERSTYVLLASLALVLLFWQWRPIPAVLWQVADPTPAPGVWLTELVTGRRRYAAIAPAAPHAQHMPSHIYTRVGYWKQSIDSNIVAARVAKESADFHDQLHAMDYLVYAYLQLGQDDSREAKLVEQRHAAQGIGAADQPSQLGQLALAGRLSGKSRLGPGQGNRARINL